MNIHSSPLPGLRTTHRVRLWCVLIGVVGGLLPCMARDAVANKWQVIETEFRSSLSYANPPHEARVEVEFVSPTGVKHRTYAFWDGTTKWKVRFSPDEIGAWSYRTECSDKRNSGLHDRTGSVICTVPTRGSALTRSGPIHVAPGAAHFEQADGTPFFWLADAAEPLALSASRNELREYASVRAAQGFTATLWRADAAAREGASKSLRAGEPVELNVRTMRRLDDAVELLRDAGLVSAIIPFSEAGLSEGELLPEGEVVTVLRQMMARWDAYPVLWVMVLEDVADSRRLARSRRILRYVFERVDHAPVMVFCGESYWVLDVLRKDPWVNALAYQTGNNISTEATLWLTSGPLTTLWSREPRLPLVNLMPAPEAGSSADGGVIGSQSALRVLCRSLFIAPPAGICYRARGVEDWNAARDTNTVATLGVALSEWQKALHLPAAKRLNSVEEFLEEAAYPKLEPKPALLIYQPGAENPDDHISVLASANSGRILLHVPAGQEARLHADRLPAEVEGIRLTLADGRREPQIAVAAGDEYRVRAPETSDCLFLLRAR